MFKTKQNIVGDKCISNGGVVLSVMKHRSGVLLLTLNIFSTLLTLNI